jgi:hypothetical protein
MIIFSPGFSESFRAMASLLADGRVFGRILKKIHFGQTDLT